MQEEQTQSKGSCSNGSCFDGMSPGKIFLFGLVQGILVLCTIGFIFMLVSGGADVPNRNAGNVVAPTPSVPTAPTAPAQITVGEVQDDEHIRGNKRADITIVEYSDLDCPFCQRFHNTMNQIIEQYGDDVRWVYRQFPLDSLHPNARTKSLATECAGEQGKFWEYTDLLFEQGGGLDQLPLYAETVGLNVASFNECMEENRYADDIRADEQDAQRAGGRGTPYSVLVGPDGETIAISGAQPFANVEAAIQQFLN